MKPKKISLLVGISFIIILVTLLGTRSEPSPTTYNYNVDINMVNHKLWKYIEPSEYRVRLKDGDSIQIQLTSNTPLDISNILFYNTCSPIGTVSGKFYITVNGKPALPTIGIVPTPSPVYMSSPMCPTYGTTTTFVFDTPDVLPPATYNFRYEGEDILIKTIELYAVKSIY